MSPRKRRTLATAVDIDGARHGIRIEEFIGGWDSIPEPVIANEVPFNSTIGYVTP